MNKFEQTIDNSSTTLEIKSIGFIGLGLIGGSLAKAFYKNNIEVYGFDVSKESLGEAASTNIFEGLTDQLDSFLNFDMDLIYICLPVQTSIEILIILNEKSVSVPITDAGSTKSSIQNIANKLKVRFCGGHPIAGKEVSGFTSSDSTLMSDAFHVLTGNDALLSASLRILHENIGMKVIEMTPAKHDKMFGLISHMPHLVAYSMIELVCKQDADALNYTGGGFRDFTRIAASDPKMWSDIFTDNKDVMLELIDQYIDQLNNWKSTIMNDNYEHMFNAITNVRNRRRKL